MTSTIGGDLTRARDAFARPTLRLLRLKWADVVLAVLASHFTREQNRIPADLFHTRVETALDELRLHGEPVPDGPIRDLCRDWVAKQWLSLSVNDDAVEEYALTSHAQEALDLVARMSGPRTMFGESRIQTILDVARRCATEASPDREERLRRLEDQIRRLADEHQRISEGGEIEPASDERMLDEYRNLYGLLAELPSDFMRLSEHVKALRTGLLNDFRADDRRSGEVLDDYLARADRLMASSPEGRAFTGAVELLRDDRLLEELREDIDAILAHPFADTELTATERLALRRTVAAIRSGMTVVLDQRRRVSSTLRNHIARHDPLRDKELDDALRTAQQELATWMQTARPRDTVPLDLQIAQADITHLRERLFDPADQSPPPPLTDPDPDVDVVSLDDIRRQGGPNLVRLRDALVDRIARDGHAGTAALFADLPPELRRPVEILGLIHLVATVRPTAGADGRTAAFETIRPDGQRRVFHAPHMVLTSEDLDALTDPSTRDTTQRTQPIQPTTTGTPGENR